MTLEKHLIDTMKEWQMKIGSLDFNIRLYYPKISLCRYLDLDASIENEELIRYLEQYLAEKANYLGNITVSAKRDRFCLMIGKEGCSYVEKYISQPEFLTKFLEVLKKQSMQNMIMFFEEYGKEHGTTVCSEKEDDGVGTVLYFEDADVEPYVYCIDENEFGITYHRFTKEEYMDLSRGE